MHAYIHKFPEKQQSPLYEEIMRNCPSWRRQGSARPPVTQSLPEPVMEQAGALGVVG